MGKGYLDIFALQMYDGVEAGSCHVIIQQIYQAIARKDPLPIIAFIMPPVYQYIILQLANWLIIVIIIIKDFGIISLCFGRFSFLLPVFHCLKCTA